MNNLGYQKKLSEIFAAQQQIITELFNQPIMYADSNHPDYAFQVRYGLRGMQISVSKSSSGVACGEFQ